MRFEYFFCEATRGLDKWGYLTHNLTFTPKPEKNPRKLGAAKHPGLVSVIRIVGYQKISANGRVPAFLGIANKPPYVAEAHVFLP